MCIILTCDSHTRPTQGLIDDCFFGNPDGAGIAWVEDGLVRISKGYMDELTLWDAIERVPMGSPMVIHMRIATSGGISKGTCHPFPITNDLEALHATDLECAAALAHNGIISGAWTDDELGVSDTVSFVSDVMAKLYKGKVTKRLKKRILNEAAGNRFAIITKDGRVTRIGCGWETVTNGIHASNSSWKPIEWRFDFGRRWGRDYELADFGDLLLSTVDGICCEKGCDQYEECLRFGPSCASVYDTAYEAYEYYTEMSEL